MWIKSKLRKGNLLNNSINRIRILNDLKNAISHKLVLFNSPAGYGKTTMVTQWLSNEANVGWFNIDETDNDNFHFVNYFIQALNNATNNSCQKSAAIVEKHQYRSLTNLFTEVIEELTTFNDKFYIVLDDYHYINNDEIDEGLRFFLKYMPDCCTIVITSRTLPSLSVAKLRMNQQLLELNTQALAFDDLEISLFIHDRLGYKIEEPQIKILQDKIEGWPSALQLIALQVQQKKNSIEESTEWISQINRAHLWDYLAEEVFNLIEKPLQTFLMQCSVFTHFNTALISDFLPDKDALKHLEQLGKCGLFLHSLGGAENWYRFHHLFGDFLSHQRKTKLQLNCKELHEKAALAWLKQKNTGQALFHSQKAKNSSLTAKILLENGWEMFSNGELEIIETAITHLDKDDLYQNPRLPLLLAWLAQSQYRYAQVGDLLTIAEEELKLRNIELSTCEKGKFNSLKALVAINQNEPQLAFKLAQTAIEQLDLQEYRFRVLAITVTAEVHHVLGELDRALSMMQQAEHMAKQYHVYPLVLWTLLQQGEILVAKGFIDKALKVLDIAELLTKEHHLQQLPLYDFLLRVRSQIYLRLNKLELAEKIVFKGISIQPKQRRKYQLQNYSILARIYIYQGKTSEAKKYIDLSASLLREGNYHADWVANANFSQILYWQVTEDQGSIIQWLEKNKVSVIDQSNHFLQLHDRNIARANLIIGHFEIAEEILNSLQEKSEKHQLICDKQRNFVLEAVLYKKRGELKLALDKLKKALILSNKTSSISNFLSDTNVISILLNELLKQGSLANIERDRAEKLLCEMSVKKSNTNFYFNNLFVKKLIEDPNVPELIRKSPLTEREWQVLGLIYSRYSNLQISDELDVAATTIKTHIRNIYQKLNILNRKEAINFTEDLIKLIGY